MSSAIYSLVSDVALQYYTDKGFPPRVLTMSRAMKESLEASLSRHDPTYYTPIEMEGVALLTIVTAVGELAVKVDEGVAGIGIE